MRMIITALLLLALCAPVFADHDTGLDSRSLPYPRIYDPLEHEHYAITDLSFEELDWYLGQPRFRKWNDVTRVCQSMQMMYGEVSRNCGTMEEAYFPRRATQRAYVTFQIAPPVYVPPRRVVVLVDPMYPPWSPQLYPYW